MLNYYVYIYLNPLKEGEFCFGKYKVKYEPFYVGKGKNGRHKVHLYITDNHNKLKQNTINKIKTSGKNPIVIKIYENISEYTAFRLEKYFINKIGRRDLGLGPLSNLTDGGEGNSGTIYNSKRRNSMISEKRSIVKYDIQGNVLEIFENIVDLSIKYPHILTNHLHRACKSDGRRKIDGCFWKYLNGESIGDTIELNDEFKPVLQYNLDGKFLREWNCINELHNIGYAGGAILKCCRNNMKKLTYYKFKDFMWFFKKNNLELQIKPYGENNAKGNNKIEKRKILMYSTDNKSLGQYSSKDLKNIGYNTKSIYACCNGKLTTTQGYKWKWVL